MSYLKSLSYWNSTLSMLPEGANAKGKATSERLETAPTQFVEAGGIRFVYRSFGSTSGTPLVFLQHFSGTMDDWDPAVVNGLAKDCPVVVFDNTGVGSPVARRLIMCCKWQQMPRASSWHSA